MGLEEEFNEILVFIRNNNLDQIRFSNENRKLLDIRDYLIHYLSTKHKIIHDDLIKLFRFKNRASISYKLKNMKELSKNREFLSNISEISKLCPIDLDNIEIKSKMIINSSSYTLNQNLDGEDIKKLESLSEELNIPIRDILKYFLNRS